MYMKHKRNVFVLVAIFLLGITPIAFDPNKASAAARDESECRKNFRNAIMSEYGISEGVANVLTYDEIFLDDNDDDGDNDDLGNGAMKRGCWRCDHEDEKAKGIAWINSYPEDNILRGNSTESISLMYSTTAAVRSLNDGNTITVYFHGVTYGCGTGASPVTNGNSYGYNGIALHILNGVCRPNHDHGTHNNCNETEDARAYLGYDNNDNPFSNQSQYAGTGNKSYVKNIYNLATSTLGRFESQAWLNSFHWSFPGQKIAVQIDVEDFINWVELHANDSPDDDTLIERGTNGADTYQDTIYVYRCPEGAGWSNVTSSTSCGTDKSYIRITIPPGILTKTCYDKYKNDTDYEHTYNGVPSWFSSTGIYYNKCSGQSVLGSRLVVDNNQIIVKRSNGDSSTANIAFVKPGANVNFDHFFFSAAQPVTKTIIDEGLTGVWTGLAPGQWQNSHNVTSTISGNGYATQNNAWSDGKTIGQPDAFNFTASYKFENGHSGAPTANGNNSWKVGTGDVIYQANYGDRTNLGSASIGELKVEGVTNVTGNINSVGFSVAAPYNFTNTAAANATAGNGTVIFAGETANMRSSFTTNPVSNGVVIGGETPYATKSPNSSMRLYTYYADSNETASGGNIVSSVSCATLGKTNCEEFNEGDNQTLNSSENVNGSTRNGSAVSVQVLDINAGKWLCGIAAVYPATSGSAANTSISGFSGWYVSSPSCIQIAKKPTFQIWNGNLYTNGSIQTNASNKSTVSGHAEITSSNPRAFSSWVEQGIISRGNNNNLASGAVMGYQYNISTVLSNEPGGHKEGNVATVCKRAPLTVANQNCVNNNNTTTNGNSGVAIVDTVDLEDYKSTATQATSLATNTNTVLTTASNYKDKDGIRYFYNSSSSSKLYLSADTLPAGANYVVYSKGSVYINGNIAYTNGGYTTPSQVPQLIIITDGSIFIDGNVTRVDAWLIAKSNDSSKGVIKTCADSNGATPQSEASCSKQLRTNGPIVARQLELNRVYGAAPGNNSATPAEIINFAPSTYIFSQSKASENTSLRTVYSKEVAPRY